MYTIEVLYQILFVQYINNQKKNNKNRDALNRKSRSVTYQMKNNNLPNKRRVLTRLNESDAE